MYGGLNERVFMAKGASGQCAGGTWIPQWRRATTTEIDAAAA